MRNVLAVFLITVLFAGTASAAGMFGPPEPLADPGKFSLDAGYMLDKTKMKQGDDRIGTRSNEYYLQGNYSFLEGLGVNGLGGPTWWPTATTPSSGSGKPEHIRFARLQRRGVPQR